VRSLKEKDELKRQLEDLVAVERDQVVKTAATDQVSNLLNFFSSLMIRMNNLEVLSQRTYSGWSNILEQGREYQSNPQLFASKPFHASRLFVRKNDTAWL